MKKLIKLLLISFIIIGLLPCLLQGTTLQQEMEKSSLTTKSKEISKSTHSPDKAFFLSLFIPGGGHFYNNNNKKGCMFASVRCILYGACCLSTAIHMMEFDRTQEETNLYATIYVLSFIPSIIMTIVDLQTAYSDAKKIRDSTAINDSLHSDAVIQIHLISPDRVPQNCSIKEKYSGEPLSKGLYAFKRLTIEENKGIFIKDNGPVIIYVTEDLKVIEGRENEKIGSNLITVDGSPESIRVIKSDNEKNKRNKGKWIKTVIYAPDSDVVK
jgi:hypothetical protein